MNTSLAAASLAALAPLALAAAPPGDWNNAGGNAGCNGLTGELGPLSPSLLWSSGPGSFAGSPPFTEGGRAFVVRRIGFVETDAPNEAPIVCFDLATGQELWSVDVPYTSGEYSTQLGGVKGGRVYASRGGWNGEALAAAPLYCFDAATGAELWHSTQLVDADLIEGTVYAPNGDPVVAGPNDLWRFDAATGAVVWQADRTSSWGAGPALGDAAVYVADEAAGGHVIKRFELATGAFGYASPLMPGLSLYSPPMVGPDGSVYLLRAQGNPTVDRLYAFDDTGAALSARWDVPAGFAPGVRTAVGPEGDLYSIGPGEVLERLDPLTGAVRSSFALDDATAMRIAADVAGRLYVSTGSWIGSSSAGRVRCLERDLTLLWDIAAPYIGPGAPALGRDGTLIVPTVNNVRAYRSPLAQDVFEISASAGGAQTLKLHAPASAGGTYWVVGSASGTSPGLSVGPVLVPLNPDAYLTWTITHPNGAILQSSLGTLDASGDATCTVNVPAGLPLLALPVELNHAFLVVDLAAATASFASNPSVVRLVP